MTVISVTLITFIALNALIGLSGLLTPRRRR